MTKIKSVPAVITSITNKYIVFSLEESWDFIVDLDKFEHPDPYVGQEYRLEYYLNEGSRVNK